MDIPQGRIGPLHDPVTWYKITYTGEQIAQWDFQNNAPAFVLEAPLRNLLTSIYNFVPCDRVVQRAYSDFCCSTWGGGGGGGHCVEGVRGFGKRSFEIDIKIHRRRQNL